MEFDANDGRIGRLLREIADMAEHASLTGSLEGGSTAAIRRYNAILKNLTAQGTVPEGLFSELSESAGYGELGVEARMLSSFISNGNGNGERKEKHKDRERFGDAGFLIRIAPFVDKSDLADLVKEFSSQHAIFDSGLLSALAPFLDKSDLGDLIRNHLKSRPSRTEWPQQSTEPRQPAEPERPAPAARQEHIERGIVPREDRTPRPSLTELSERLGRPDLSPQERQQIAIQLAEIAHEEASK